MRSPLRLASALGLMLLFVAADGLAALAAKFEEADLKSGEGRWLSYSDEVAGGTSKVEFSIAGQDDDRHLRMHGSLTAAFFYPFAGVQWLFNANGTPRDVSAHTGIRFRAKGDGNVYRAQLLLATVRDNNNFSFEFVPDGEWRQYEVPFNQLKQAEWGAKVAWDASLARGVGFHIDGGVVDFDLAVDDIELY